MFDLNANTWRRLLIVLAAVLFLTAVVSVIPSLAVSSTAGKSLLHDSAQSGFIAIAAAGPIGIVPHSACEGGVNCNG